MEPFPRAERPLIRPLLRGHLLPQGEKDRWADGLSHPDCRSKPQPFQHPFRFSHRSSRLTPEPCKPLPVSVAGEAPWDPGTEAAAGAGRAGLPGVNTGVRVLSGGLARRGPRCLEEVEPGKTSRGAEVRRRPRSRRKRPERQAARVNRPGRRHSQVPKILTAPVTRKQGAYGSGPPAHAPPTSP